MVILTHGASADAIGTAVIPRSITACVGVADTTARLACYDSAVHEALGATFNPNALPAPPVGSVAVRVPPPAGFGDEGQLRDGAYARHNAPSQIKATIMAAATLPRDRYLLTLDNQQVWKTTEANWSAEFHVNDVVTISRLAFGGYQVALSGQNRGLSVKRIR